LHNNGSGVSKVVFSPDGKLLAASTTHHSHVKLWEVDTRKYYATFQGAAGWAQSLAFSHNSKLLAFGSANHLVYLWDVSEKKQLPPFTGHTGEVHGVAFSPDDKLLVTSCNDHNVRLLDLARREEILVLRGFGSDPVTFTPDGKGLICAKDKDLVHLALFPRTDFRTFTEHRDGILALACSPDGKYVASTSRDGSARMWNIDNYRHRQLNGFAEPQCIAFAQGSKTVYVGGKAYVGLWDVKSEKKKTAW
jgi:WD40 repeat protein